MKAGLSQAAILALASTALAVPMPSLEVTKREVPQEHSHDLFLAITREALNKNNPKQIKDVVFGLLGNAAAAGGAGQVTNLDCLQQETADQAFTNGKAAGDIRLMAAALVYRAVERNTGKVGLASVTCTEKAANPEVAAVVQHQDPASANAASVNKAITLSLAKQLQSIGADPELALMSGTFAPGKLDDNTGAGNTCDTPDEQLGCIFQTGKLVLDATQQEIAQAVASTPAGAIKPGPSAGKPLKASDLVDLSKFATSSGAKGNGGSNVQPKPSKTNPPATSVAAKPAPASTGAAAAAGNNVQTFKGALGGPPPPVISSASERPFSVNGDTFLNAGAALGRSCDVQHNACANAANSGKLSGGVGQCDTQNNECKAAASSSSGSVAKPNNAQNQNPPAKANTGSSSCDQQGTPPASSSPSSQTGGNSGNEFGSCSDPGIKFADGLDGRKEPAFAPRNAASFQHGSALNIGVISDFICGQLKDKCKASSGTVAKCQAASAAAKQKTGEASAAAFNSALGV